MDDIDGEDDGDESEEEEEEEDVENRVVWDLDSFNDDVSDTEEQHKHNRHSNDAFWDFILLLLPLLPTSSQTNFLLPSSYLWFTSCETWNYILPVFLSEFQL